MKLDDAIRKAREIQSNARGPRKGRKWQKVPPPENPKAEPLRPVAPVGTAPPPITIGPSVPQRPLPPIAVGSDALKQFTNSTSVPQRRVFGPTPL
jgi:hypothetical protein